MVKGAALRHLPIIPYAVGELTPNESWRLDSLAEQLRQQEPALRSSNWFGPLVTAGMGVGPWTILSDHREIALATEEFAYLYEYRLSMLARDGDCVVLSGARHEEFEEYRRSKLGLGSFVALQAPLRPGAAPRNLAARCLEEGAMIERLAEIASRAGELTVLPYMGSGHTWLLGREISQRASVPVYVAAPPPALVRRVNDKAWFARTVEALLGPNAVPPAIAISGAAAMAASVRALAERSDFVAVKIPDSAGSVGNLVFPARSFRGRRLREVRETLITRLREVGWNARYPLVVQVWETKVLSSPSVQIWVPNLGDGLPIIEGIFEQIVEGEKAKFVGSRASHLCDDVCERVIREGSQLAGLFQRLGYFGRMSLDCILTRQANGGTLVGWIECNGRWGGVSIPMTLVNRLTGNWHLHPFVVAQRTDLDLPPRTFRQILDLLSELLFPRGQKLSGVVLLAPQALELGRGYQFVAVADDESEAYRLAEMAIARCSADRDI